MPQQCIERLDGIVQSQTIKIGNLTNENAELRRLYAESKAENEVLKAKIKMLEDKLNYLMEIKSGESDSSNSPPLMQK